MISPEIIKIASDTSNCGIKKKSNLIATSKNTIHTWKMNNNMVRQLFI